MTRNIAKEMQHREHVRALMREKRRLALQKEALILLSLGLSMLLGVILIAI